MVDLWPHDIGLSTKLKAPVTILKEQASLLGEKTRNLIEAKVTGCESQEIAYLHTKKGDRGEFAYNFYLVAPTLGHYQYKLLTAVNDIQLYPVHIYVDGDIYGQIRSATGGRFVAESEDITHQRFVTASEDEFLELLRNIFSAQKTRRVITALLAQAGADEEELPF